MSKEKSREKFGISGGIAVLMQIQMVIVGLALIITGYGAVCSLNSPRRLIVYILQAITCLTILFFGLFHFHTRKIIIFKVVIYCYAALEAVRCALLSTTGISEWPSVLAKLLLVALACGLVVLAEHLGERKYASLSYLLIFFEAALFLLFGLLFNTGGRLLFKILPLVGVLICGSICLFNEAKIRQVKHDEESTQ